MKRVIVIILVILLIAGGGAGGLMMMGLIPNPFNPTSFGAPLTDAERAAQELAAARFKPPRAAFNLIKLDDMIIPVILDGRLERRVFVIARLRVDRAANESAVQAQLRVYQDAVLKDLVPFLQLYYADHDAIDAVTVKERLTVTAKAVYGDKVLDVVLINVFDQATSAS